MTWKAPQTNAQTIYWWARVRARLRWAVDGLPAPPGYTWMLLDGLEAIGAAIQVVGIVPADLTVRVAALREISRYLDEQADALETGA